MRRRKEMQNRIIDKSRIDKTIGRNIRRERTLRKLSREELSMILDLTVSHLGLIERGERGATVVTLEKLSLAFDLPIDQLVSEPDKNKSRKKVRDIEKNPYREKVNTLCANMSETELMVLAYTITGLLESRGVDVDQLETE